MVALPMDWHVRNIPVPRSAFRMLPHWEIAVMSVQALVVGTGVVGVVLIVVRFVVVVGLCVKQPQVIFRSSQPHKKIGKGTTWLGPYPTFCPLFQYFHQPHPTQRGGGFFVVVGLPGFLVVGFGQLCASTKYAATTRKRRRATSRMV
jgi:hypothetical protein